MSEHAISETSGATTSSTAPVGAPFFPVAEPDLADARPHGNVVRPYPWTDDDHQPEPEISPEMKLADTKDVVTLAFGWMSTDVEARLSALEADLRAKDDPTFGDQLIRAAFRTALSAATSGASEYVAGLLVGGEAEALRELVKSAFESSVGEALEIGAGALRGSSEPLTAFIAAQKAAARHLYRKAQASWVHKGRHRVRTQVQADALEASLTQPQMAQAADFHYVASRDAWVTYLAQMKYGVRHSKAIDENYDIIDLGPTTDLTPSSQREADNQRRPGNHSTTDSPDKAEAFLGVAPGVLTVQAELPAIPMIGDTGYYGMSGTTTVTHAYLNGVNEIIRDQYKGKPLSSARVPRVIMCHVSSGEDFTVRINEQGVVFGGGDDAEWLRRRAIVGRPQDMAMPDVVLKQIGLDLLLADLVPQRILKGTSE